MRFIYVNPDTNEKVYPFGGFDALRKLHPNVSFPSGMSPERLAEWGVFEVTEVPQPSATRTEGYVQGEPALVNGAWTMTWVPVARTAEEVTAYDQAVARRVRARRDTLLQKSDFSRLDDVTVDKAAWATFRQALRDISSQPGFPHNVTWPAVPSGARLEE